VYTVAYFGCLFTLLETTYQGLLPWQNSGHKHIPTGN